MKNKSWEKLKNSKFNILVVGDIMLDQYLHGLVERISPESPVPVFNYIKNKIVLGGAANVALNLSVLNQSVSIMSVIGNDLDGEILLNLLDENNINRDLIIFEDNRKTTKKIRLLAQNNQQMLRIDNEDINRITQDSENTLLKIFEQNILKYDYIVISDYMKGLLTKRLTTEIVKISNVYNKKTFIDVKDNKYEKYSNAYLIKPNKKELSLIIEKELNDYEDIIDAAKLLKIKSNVTNILVTLGADGMILINDYEEILKIDAIDKPVYDVTGAGDTVLAYYCLANFAGLSNEEAMSAANIAASIKVSKVGTAPITLIEIEKYIGCNKYQNNNKLYYNNVSELTKLLKDKKVVFTNGCFDILHIGHVEYLTKAKQLGEVLVVGLNSDKSVEKLKGKNRPIINQNERAEILLALKCVDYVVIFDDETPYEIIKLLKPSVLVKGGDYSKDAIVGKDIVESNGGVVEIIDYVNEKSTTNILNKILIYKGTTHECL